MRSYYKMFTPSLVALLLILMLLVLVVVMIAHLGKPRLNKSHFIKQWQAIEKSENYVMSVMKADSLVDEALRRANIKGGTMGERLNNSVGFIKDVNAAWAAHKLRNRIAHESNAEPSAMECQRALRQFKRALKDLGAL